MMNKLERLNEFVNQMRDETGYVKKRMSRETGLSYNTIKSYLVRMAVEASDARRTLPGDLHNQGESASPRL